MKKLGQRKHLWQNLSKNKRTKYWLNYKMHNLKYFQEEKTAWLAQTNYLWLLMWPVILTPSSPWTCNQWEDSSRSRKGCEGWRSTYQHTQPCIWSMLRVQCASSQHGEAAWRFHWCPLHHSEDRTAPYLTTSQHYQQQKQTCLLQFSLH